MTKHQIKICLGSSCFSRGNNINLEHIKQYLKENKLEADIAFSGHLCEDRCNKGPVVYIDGHQYEEVNKSRLYKILKEELSC